MQAHAIGAATYPDPLDHCGVDPGGRGSERGNRLSRASENPAVFEPVTRAGRALRRAGSIWPMTRTRLTRRPTCREAVIDRRPELLNPTADLMADPDAKQWSVRSRDASRLRPRPYIPTMTMTIALALGMVVVAIVLLSIERIPIEVASISIVVLLVFAGFVSPAEALAGFSSETAIFIFALLALTQGLATTGFMQLVGRRLLTVARFGPQAFVAVLLGIVCAFSSVASNTAVTAAFLPVAMASAAQVKVPPAGC